MADKVLKFFKTPTGSIVASIIVALGIVSILRKSCNGPTCIQVRAPDSELVAESVWTVGDEKCLRFTPVPVKCPTDSSKVIEEEEEEQ
jgi:hypothetical protein